ncbi:MAG: alpha/beta fold hydrolase [Gammaproteobacteria bacterium]
MYQPTENPAITRHFANLGDRQLHFRLAGSGPPLVLLHQSPTSSAEMATDIEVCAHSFTVIAIDLPGYGLSDPLPDEHPDIGQFADDVERVVSTLGLDRVLLYGFHTGAVVAFEFACRYPERCAGAVVNGLVCIEGDELDDLLEHYNVLPDVTAEGAHLPWLWARLRDQSLFFPWYRKTPDARMALDLHDGAYLHPYLVDFLRAKEGGRPGYQAAFSYPTRERAPEIRAPVYLVNFEPDPLTTHPERVSAFPSCVSREIFGDFTALHRSAMAYLRARAPADVDVPRRSVGEFTGAWQKETVNTDAGPVCIRCAGSGADGAILLLHDAGSSSMALAPLSRRLADEFDGRRRILCIDLPGHGDTGELHLPAYNADSVAILVGLVLGALELRSVDIVAIGASAPIACALASGRETAVGKMILIDPWVFGEEERQHLSESCAPKMMPGDYGQHLLEAWYYARDSELYWPWNEPHPQNALTRPPDIDPEHVQARTVDVLKAGIAFPKLVRDLLSADCGRAFATLDCEIVIGARAGNGHEVRARETADLNPRARYRRLAPDAGRWCGEAARLLKPGSGIGHNTAI